MPDREGSTEEKIIGVYRGYTEENVEILIENYKRISTRETSSWNDTAGYS